MSRTKSVKIPIAEIWKRRLVLMSVCNVILTLVGLVMVSVECTKLQSNAFNYITYIGFSQAIVGLLALYIVFAYTIYWHDQYPTGPVLVSSHALYFLIGLALVCVAYIVPADDMFHFVTPEIKISREIESSVAEHSITHKNALRHRSETGTELTSEHSLIGGKWSLNMVIQNRLSLLGGIMCGIGLSGGIVPLFVIYRVHRGIEIRKRQELERRARMKSLQTALRTKNHDAMKILNRRDSVYDYAGWRNRTGDIFHGHYKEDGNEERESSTSSMASPATGKKISEVAEETFSQWYQRIFKNMSHDVHDNGLMNRIDSRPSSSKSNL